jgi:holliday junction DNA helicase RuvA
MIAMLRGEPHCFGENSVVIMNHGVGYEVFMTVAGIDNVRNAEAIDLFISSISSDTGTKLYGFEWYADKETFCLLITVPGLGANSAMNLMNQMDTKDILRALKSMNAGAFKKVKGIGPKTAAAMVKKLSKVLN